MSASGRQFTDEVLNRVLDLWLNGGPATMPEGSLESALRAVAVTPQRRWRGRLLRFSGASPLVPVGLSLAAITAVVALGIGIGSVLPPTGTDASPTPEVSTTPAPSAEPSDAADERLVWYTNSEDGYELRLPESWAASAQRFHSVVGSATVIPGATRFVARSMWSMTISIGTADGTVSACDRAGMCQLVVVKTLDDLDWAVANPWVDLPRAFAVENVSLGGELGRLEYPRATCTPSLCKMGVHLFSPSEFPGTRTVVALHNGRPVILQFEWFSSSPAEVQAIIDSFRFLDSAPSPEASPTPSGSAWRVVTDVAHGYALEVPAGWEDRECCSPGGRTFYASEALRLAIMVGDADGTITICQHGDCAEIVAAHLSDLRDAVQSVASPITAWTHTLKHDPLILGGEPAEREWPDSNFLAGPEPIYDWVYTIHDGRPIVLRYSHFRVPADLRQILESFTFLD